jgi:anti-sigma regulatory factor (Ser/Thr protein kinase)
VSVDEGSVLRCGGDVAELAGVRAFVRRSAATLGADEAATDDIVQAVDEWVTNVALHGYRGAGGPVEVELARDEAGIVVRVRDRAPAFDPAGAPAFDPAVPLERRRPGGMGIHLIREVTDQFVHRALPRGGNEVTMHMALDSSGGNV